MSLRAVSLDLGALVWGCPVPVSASVNKSERLPFSVYSFYFLLSLPLFVPRCAVNELPCHFNVCAGNWVIDVFDVGKPKTGDRRASRVSSCRLCFLHRLSAYKGFVKFSQNGVMRNFDLKLAANVTAQVRRSSFRIARYPPRTQKSGKSCVHTVRWVFLGKHPSRLLIWVRVS
jgi:hypothetical protein